MNKKCMAKGINDYYSTELKLATFCSCIVVNLVDQNSLTLFLNCNNKKGKEKIELK